LSLTQGKAAVRANIRFWVLANSLFTGIGAIVAGGHILTVLTAVIVAPFSPFIPAGPGTVAAIVQLLVRPPLVKDFQTFPEDLSDFRAWRRNRILRILLVMVLCGLGSLLGTVLGTSKIILSLFGQN
jgi:pheromone shutdown protein TraB